MTAKRLGTVVVLIVASMLAGMSAHADPRLLKSNVVIVKPQYHDKTRKVFAEWAQTLSRLADDVQAKAPSKTAAVQALRGLASYYDNQARTPWHGSGWLWIPKGGGDVAYVVTNKHVAGQAGSVTIEFDNGRHPAITGNQVTYVDGRHDVAVIAVPRAELPREATGFDLTDTALTEGNPVWAAGFPGTDTSQGHIPAYSLTNGIVSNADFPGPEGRALATTATIDPGNSGGPLLVEVPTTRLGYRVAGMNTWRATTRTNVSLAVPVDVVRDVLSKAEESRRIAADPNRLADALHATTQRLADELGSAHPDYKLLKGMIAYSFVAERPEIIGVLIKELLTGKMSEDQFERFRESPVEYSREMLWALFFTTFSTGASHVGDVRLIRVVDEARIAIDKPIRTIYQIAGQNEEIVWVWEHGAWRIADASFEQALRGRVPATPAATRTAAATPAGTEGTASQPAVRKPAAPFVARRAGLGIAVRVGLGSSGASGSNGFASSIDTIGSTSFGVEVTVPVSRYLWLSSGLGYEPLGAAYDITDADSNQLTIEEEVGYLRVPVALRLDLPVTGRTATLHAYGRAGAALDVAVDKGGTYDGSIGYGSLTDPGITWYDEHNTLNVAALYGLGVEVGLGAAPHYFFGLDFTGARHVLDEWTDQQFTGGANYKYNSFHVGLYVKYQGLK